MPDSEIVAMRQTFHSGRNAFAANSTVQNKTPAPRQMRRAFGDMLLG